MAKSQHLPLVLLIEDDTDRIGWFRKQVRQRARVVSAVRANQAVGVIRRAEEADYIGILLDHDLNQQSISGVDNSLSGTDVASLLAELRPVLRDPPVLIHSMNDEKRAVMARLLTEAGYLVTVVPFGELLEQPGRFQEWLEDALADAGYE